MVSEGLCHSVESRALRDIVGENIGEERSMPHEDHRQGNWSAVWWPLGSPHMLDIAFARSTR